MWLWPVSALVGFPIGGLVADLVVDGVDSVAAAIGDRWPVFGASGALVFGVLTWLLLAVLFRAPEAAR